MTWLQLVLVWAIGILLAKPEIAGGLLVLGLPIGMLYGAVWLIARAIRNGMGHAD